MGFRWGWWWKRGEGEGGPFWKRAPLPPRAPPSPPKTFIQVGMARPRRWAQGLSSPQTGKGAGEAGGERAPPVRQMPDRQQGTDDRGGFRGIFKREKWKEDWQKRAFVCHAATHKSSRWGNRPEAEQAVPVTTRAATGKDRRRQPDRRCVPAAVLFIVKKQPAKKPGDRHQGAGPRVGQAVRDLMKRFWKGEGDRPKAAAGRARYDTAAMAKDRRGQRDRRCLLLFYQ